MVDGEARRWFLAHGWQVSASDRGREGWRWSHDAVLERFEVDGSWDASPAVSDAMIGYAVAKAKLELDAFN